VTIFGLLRVVQQTQRFYWLNGLPKPAIFWWILFLVGQTSFPRMVTLIDWDPICLSLEVVAVRTGLKVLMEVDDNSAVIVGDPQGALSQKLMLCPIHLIILLFLVY
jgi:hypothetical protein